MNLEFANELVRLIFTIIIFVFFVQLLFYIFTKTIEEQKNQLYYALKTSTIYFAMTALGRITIFENTDNQLMITLYIGIFIALSLGAAHSLFKSTRTLIT